MAQWGCAWRPALDRFVGVSPLRAYWTKPRTKLVCSDGRNLRADRPALSTLDSLLMDPARESVLFKIWNRNGPAAIVGAFNRNFTPGAPMVLVGFTDPWMCRASWASALPHTLTARRALRVVTGSERWQVDPSSGAFEFYTMVPTEQTFAAIGLADMFDSRATVLAKHARGSGRW